ncbi:MAG: response regulator, partial [Deltaproteobacteria bacterium]|nr:response regulator [Deltaproteobacteria bacterium]
MLLSKGFSTPVASQTELKSRAEQLPVLLVVDDEPEITASLSDLFRYDYQVVTAACADEAQAVLKQQDVSVIVADQRMPGKTGAELMRESRVTSPETVRILLTAYADIEAVIQAVNEGEIYYYLKKPWHNDELKTVIAKAADHNLLLKDRRRLVEDLQRLNVKLEERVQLRTAQLETLYKEIESFSYSVSHSLKAPLRGIEGYSRLLEIDHSDQLNDDGRQFIKNIRCGAAQMQQLIENLL